MILTLNRKIHRAYNLVREQNFLLTNLLGFDLQNKMVGIIGTGKIGTIFAKIMHGFGCNLLAFDPSPIGLTAAIRGVWIGLEYSDRPLLSNEPKNAYKRYTTRLCFMRCLTFS